MNFKQIEAFVYITEQGSFSKAAKTLYLTQPTISSHISELEKEMNTRLFYRHKKQVSLTEDGKNFYEYAKRLILLMEQIDEKFLTKQTDDLKTELIIAASSVPAQHLLPKILYHFRERYPQRPLVLNETDSLNVADMIMNRQADIGFSGTKVTGKNCKFIPIYKDQLVLITPNEPYFRSLDIKKNLVEFIRSEPLLLREKGSGTRKETLKILEKLGIYEEELHIAASIENTETIKQSVIKGTGISILSALAAKDIIDSQKVLSFSLGDEIGFRDLYLVYNRDFGLSVSANKFINIVKKLYHY